MEINEDGFLEELLALRRETWETNNPTTEINGFFSTTTWGFEGLDSISAAASILPSSSISYDSSFSSPIGHSSSLVCSTFNDFYANSEPLISAADHQMSSEQGEGQGVDHVPGTCKSEPVLTCEIPSSPFAIGSCVERNAPAARKGNKVKKIEGQPSKNLMAERRRRKRLNDRLSMLRSVVPKISKMDRTSILGDTIDYMKELLERINILREEIDVGSNQLNVMSMFKDVKPNDILVRNSPKFDVERRKLDTRVEICCASKPSLLLATVTTLEALGLEIQQCVVSCFNDFLLQASCSEEMEKRSLTSSDDIKQALLRNAGYGGRCF